MKHPDTAAIIWQARITLGMSSSQLARVAMVAHGRLVQRWAAGEIRPSHASLALVQLAVRAMARKKATDL